MKSKNARTRAALTVFLTLISLSQVLGASPVFAESPIDWSEPEPLSKGLGSSWFPEIHADAYGTVRAIWESNRDLNAPNVSQENGVEIMLTSQDGSDWVEPADIYVKDTLNAARPILASDDEFLHLISRSPRNEGRFTISALSAIYYMRAPLTSDVTDARSWSEPIRLTSGPAYWADMKYLSDGVLVVTYNEIIQDAESSTNEQRGVLFSRRSLDNGATWSRPVKISYTQKPVGRSSLVQSPVDGTLILAWDEGYDNLTGRGQPAGIFTAISTDNGASWEAPGPLDDLGPSERRLTYAARGVVEQSTLVATADTTMLVYRSVVADALLYRLSDDQGRTWTDEALIPEAIPRDYTGVHHFDKLALAADGDGRIIFAYVGQDLDAPWGLSVFVMTYEDDKWSSPVAIASPRGFAEYPRLAATGGNQVHIVYFVRDDKAADQGGHYEVWAASGTTPATPVSMPDPPVAEDQPAKPETGAQATPTEAASQQLAEYPSLPDKPGPIDQAVDTPDPQSAFVSRALVATIATAGALLVIVVATVIVRQFRLT